MESMSILPTLVIASGVLSLLCLLALHYLSPEFEPGWRMISEYAMGKHKWLLTLFFISWGVCTMLAAVMLWDIVTSLWATIGAMLVFISGVGALMGGLFDLKHKLHGLAFALGVPTLPIGGLLISYNLLKNDNWAAHQLLVLLSAHALWVTPVLMAFSMMLLFSGFKKAGIATGPNQQPPQALPAGVIGINGYANRILVIAYISWPVVIAGIMLWQ